MLADAQHCVEEINIVMTHFGRVLYKQGKSYNQYAETLNSLGTIKPGIRRRLQQSWDLGYAWARSEPSNHHVAMPVAIFIAMITTALSWVGHWLLDVWHLVLGFIRSWRNYSSTARFASTEGCWFLSEFLPAICERAQE